MKAAFRILLAIAVSALLLGLLFQLTEGTAGQPGLRDVLSRMLPLFVLFYFLCTLAQSLLRAARYRVLLAAAAEPVIPRFMHILLVTLSRNMFVDLLPARLGELSYVALLNRGYSVSTQRCLSSLAISFVFDLLALLAILGGLSVVAFARWMPGVLIVMAALIGAAFFFLFPALHAVAAKGRAGGFLRKLADAFDETRRAGVFMKTFLLSLGVRFWKYAGFYFMFLAVALPSFPKMAESSPGHVLVTLISAEASSSLPVPTFMSFGAYEAGGAAAWSALGAAASDAALCMLALHIGSQVIDYALGGLGLLFISLFATPTRSGRRNTAVLIAFALLALAATAAFAFRERQQLLKKGSLQAPPSGESLSPSSVLRPLSSGPNGFLLWSSNRSGNHDIWKMSLPDMSLEQVTTNAHAEFYPRISPDGQSLVFARAHRTWVSQRNERDWDVYWRDLSTGAEKLIATNATAPTWADVDTVVFQQEASRVVAHDLRSGAERVLCESGKGNIPEGVSMETPQYNVRDKLVAATFRGSSRMTALVDEQNQFRKVAGGCELFWSPDNTRLYYVDHGGRMKNAFYLVSPETLARTLWFDAPGDWSHEYFPKVSNDGHWLVYGAAAKGHEHDTADYEIFLWKIGDPFENSVRLTWHTGNDCWPDIYVK